MNENRPHHVKEISHVEDPPMHINRYLRTFNSHEKIIISKRLELKNPAILTKSTKAQRIRRDQFLKRGF
ncbi:uncharacterized protein OCT59_018926 [Rhizophagus irregularis]|uniref:uncharacterized protein n=1 Tax=Rhizophagus irregularis TaxID=588596 RepID=UPI00331E5F42|nr:hypothetical protein OCT59_018926 [Rhizophagus irregularis]